MASTSGNPPRARTIRWTTGASVFVLAVLGVVMASLIASGQPLGWISWALAAASFAVMVALATVWHKLALPLASAAHGLRRHAAGETGLRLNPDTRFRTVRDLATAFNAAADRFDEERERHLLVSEATGDVIWEWNARSDSVTWTGELRSLFGVKTDEFEADSTWWHARIHPTERQAVETHLQEAFDGGVRTWSDKYRFRREDGTYRWFWDRGIFVRDSNGKALRIVGCMTDITAQREVEDRIRQLADEDELTGLPNRKCFRTRLDAMLAGLQSGTSGGALLLVDIDEFKIVNDTLGHPAGDVLLRAVSARLRASVGDSGTVFRLGGDEFAILLPECDDGAAAEVARRALADLAEPVVVADQRVSPRATMGIVHFPKHGASADTLLQNADLALYEGKARGRNQVSQFAPGMRDALESRMSLIAEVRTSMLLQRFRPHYQPIVRLRGGTVHGAEALMRWEHPERGLLGPSAFYAAFEDAELSVQLGDRLVECVIADFRALDAAGLAPSYLAINLSSAVARLPDLAERLLARLTEGGMSPGRLCVELTETLLFGEHSDLIGATIRRLHAAGVRIALDDFGTGYASLTHLQKLPVDAIKIDQSFVRSIATDPGSQAITSTVLELGRRLGMDVIAEGVELVEHAAILSAAGCTFAQGYYFARPMPAADLMTFMASQRGEAPPEMRARRA